MEGDQHSWYEKTIHSKATLDYQLKFVKAPFFNIPNLVQVSLNKVHHTIVKLFPRELLNVRLAGRLKYFEKNGKY